MRRKALRSPSIGVSVSITSLMEGEGGGGWGRRGGGGQQTALPSGVEWQIKRAHPLTDARPHPAQAPQSFALSSEFLCALHGIVR